MKLTASIAIPLFFSASIAAAQDAIALAVGSGMMTASTGSQEFVFSRRLPASVSIVNQGSGGTSVTYFGACNSSSAP